MKTTFKRQSTPQEIEIFFYLNALRVEGSINMFGAGPHVAAMFGLSRKEAHRIVALWMTNFNEEGNYDEIEDETTNN